MLPYPLRRLATMLPVLLVVSVAAPGAAIFPTTLSFSFVDDGLRDALDPRLRP